MGFVGLILVVVLIDAAFAMPSSVGGENAVGDLAAERGSLPPGCEYRNLLS